MQHSSGGNEEQQQNQRKSNVQNEKYKIPSILYYKTYVYLH